MNKDYNVALQKLFLEIMQQNPEIYVRVQNIYNPENFDRSLKESAHFIKTHVDNFRTMPTVEQIKGTCSIELEPIPNLNENHYDWFMSEFESFTKKNELERAILKAADMIENGEFGPVEKLIKDAVQISLTKDMGTDYFADPRSRLLKIKSNNGQITTGWPTLDKRLFGGMNRGELNIFAGGSGAGKSLFLANLGVNWALQGLNVVYLTLELAEDLVAMRIDAMTTGISTKNIFKELDDVEIKVRIIGKKSGALQIKYMPSGKTSNDIRAYMKEFEVKTGKKIDVLLVDYLDLLMPSSHKISAENLFIKDKYVSEELRNLAMEKHCILVTAAQLNRGAVEEVEFDHSHISGGLSKIQTADNVFGIFTSRAMRERGRYQIQLMKTRSSSGVGMKVDLDYDIESLRITDPGEEAQGTPGTVKPQIGSIMNQIKVSNKSVQVDKETGEISPPQAEIQSNKLKQMLADLKSKSE